MWFTNSVVTREEVTLIPCFLLSLHLVTFLMLFSLVQRVFTKIKIFDFTYINKNDKDKTRKLSEQCAVTDTRT